jgi:uncharacterized protein (DUF39 family)
VSSLAKAREIADILKKQIQKGEFMIQEPVQMFPTNTSLKELTEVEIKEEGGQ